MGFLKNIAVEFKKFALRGSVIDLSVGIIIGAAFNKVVGSLVTDVVMPPIGFFLGRMDFSAFFVDLSSSGHTSLVEAQKVGAPTINYGIFINSLIGFLITASAVFLLVKFINKLHDRTLKTDDHLLMDCSFCLTKIKIGATKCPSCTSELRGSIKQ